MRVSEKRASIGSGVLIAIMAAFVAWNANDGASAPAEKKKPADKIPARNAVPSAQAQGPQTFPDAGSDDVYNPGVDLVVSKVVFKRGTFGSDPARKIQIVPYVKNMWRGRTRARIKILLDGLGMAEWIETGIEANEEKSGGALYVLDPKGRRSLRFSVEVDNNNTIPETNDHNNRCEGVSFPSKLRMRTHRCRIVGPHEPLI